MAKEKGHKAAVAIAAMLGVLTLSGCATVPMGGSAMRDGGVTMPPAGWLDFCGRNANDPSCKAG